VATDVHVAVVSSARKLRGFGVIEQFDRHDVFYGSYNYTINFTYRYVSIRKLKITG
jgi:hypothetical protein